MVISMIMVKGNAELSEFMSTHHAVSSGTDFLDGRHQHADEHEGNTEDDKEFNEGEGRSIRPFQHSDITSHRNKTLEMIILVISSSSTLNDT